MSNLGLQKLQRGLYARLIRYFPPFRPLHETQSTQTPIRMEFLFWQKIVGFNRAAYWPMHWSSIVTYPNRIYAGIETCPGYMPGCYIQAINGIHIGDYTQIAANVGIISANHELYDNREHVAAEPIRIGEYSWIGMGAIILPGVQLGDFSIVGAGSIVTRSYPEGYQVIAGNPARMIKKLDPELCVRHRSQHEYNGYLPHERFVGEQKRWVSI